MRTGWRVVSPEYGGSPEAMMSGEGAFLYGGRWNSKGTRMVYLGSSLAQAAMELFIHLNRTDVLNRYVKMSVTFDESLMQHIAVADLPDDWADLTMAPSVQGVGDAWVAANSSVILQVPSAAVAGEYNYLLNPRHPDFRLLEMSAISPFKYDQRMVK